MERNYHPFWESLFKAYLPTSTMNLKLSGLDSDVSGTFMSREEKGVLSWHSCRETACVTRETVPHHVDDSGKVHFFFFKLIGPKKRLVVFRGCQRKIGRLVAD